VDEANFRTERDVVKEEFRQSVLAPPYGEFGEWIFKASFAEHPYKRPTIGNIEELDASSLDEVLRFHATFYRPDNAVLVVVGDFDPPDLQRWVDRYFGPIAKPGSPIPRVAVKEPPRTGERTLREVSAKPPVPALAVTFLAPPVGNPEAPALEVLQQVLSGGESSRLYHSLVYEKEIAQSAECEADLRTDLGLVIFELVLASGVEVPAARAALFDEIRRITDAPVSAAELDTAKNQLLAERLGELETNTGKAMALGEAAAVRGDPALANADLARLGAVTADQVQAAARRWLRNPLVLEYLPAETRPDPKKHP
jgi:zinc protease